METDHFIWNKKNGKAIKSPLKLFLLMILLIIIIDIARLFLIHIFPELTLFYEIMVNLILILVILVPVLYFFAYYRFKLTVEELQKAENEARKNEEKFRKVFMTSPDAISVKRISDGEYMLINEGFTKMFQYNEEEIVGRSFRAMNILDSSEELDIIFNTLYKKGNAENIEVVLQKKDGKKFSALVSASLLELDGVAYFLTVTKDISNSKRIEGELLRDQLLIDALMNNLTDYIYIKDCESRFQRINRSSAHAFGLEDPDQIIGKSDRDFYLEEDAKKAYKDEQAIIRTGQPIIKEEKLSMKDGTDMWLLTTKMPLLDKDRNIVGTFGISKNITEQKNLEEALHLKHLQLEAIIANSPDHIYYKDRNSKFVLCNTPLALLAGCTSEKELIGKSDFDFYPHDLAQQYFNVEQALMENGHPLLNYEEPLSNNQTGELHWFLSSKVPVKDADGNVIGLVGISRDITDRKKSEDEIRSKNESLQNLNTEKDKFFSIVAHDLRGPLSSFVAATKMITDEINTMSIEEIKEITLSMRASATNVYTLLENLLEWSRLKRGVMDFVPERFNLKEKIQACVDVLSESAKKKSVDLEVEISEDIYAFADNHMFDTVILNLISNAIKFSYTGGKVTLMADYNIDHYIEIKVKDSGIGMSPELISKLFLITEKTSRTGTQGEPSTGLGLLLCKEFIEKHGGKIWVESAKGKGSTFIFTLPDKGYFF